MPGNESVGRLNAEVLGWPWSHHPAQMWEIPAQLRATPISRAGQHIRPNIRTIQPLAVLAAGVEAAGSGGRGLGFL